MTRFSFIARNMKGDVVRDSLEAASTQDARAILVEKGLLVEDIHEDATTPQPTLDALSSTSSFPAWTTVDDHAASPTELKAPLKNNSSKDASSPSFYFPFLETLRLYAGWLMAWYLGIYALGYYQQSRGLPFALEYIENLYRSPLVLSFTLGAFLFLFFSNIHRVMGRGKLLGFILFAVGVGVFILYRKNVA